MCASTPEKVEVLAPPADSKPGDKVTIEGFVGTPDAQLNPKKKVSSLEYNCLRGAFSKFLVFPSHDKREFLEVYKYIL